jgi:hypothetical protein
LLLLQSLLLPRLQPLGRQQRLRLRLLQWLRLRLRLRLRSL